MGFRMSTKRAQKGFAKMRQQAPAVADSVASDNADRVFPETQRIVPRDTNALARSGRVEHNGPGSYSIWYGDSPRDNPDPEVVDYAAAVHEILEAHHVPPTQAKYVEQPLVESIPEFKADAVQAFKRLARRSF